MRTIIPWLFVFRLAATAFAQSNDDAGVSYTHKGLTFEAGAGPGVSISRGSSNVGYVVFMSAGYCISSDMEVGIRVYTGAQDVPSNATALLAGRFALGGGGIEARYFPAHENAWRPFVMGGYELVTLLNGGGYNGGGPALGLGVQWNVSSYFALNAAAQYSGWRFYNLVNQDDPDGTFSPFVDRTLSSNISISFYPNILP